MKFGKDVGFILRKLIKGYMVYFSRGALNSDGRRLFEEAARMIVYEHPELKPLISKARRNPTLENILKIAERVLGGEARVLLASAINGPYYYYRDYEEKFIVGRGS